ncbi:MAG: indole-3-glycerol phosphate synthase TrpC [Gemmatimonadales bacterium]
MPASLPTILASTRHRLPALRRRSSELEAAALAAPKTVPWANLFECGDVAVIAEVKRRSPSAGPIADDLDPVEHARSCQAGGARAISVLTDAEYFGGSLADLRAVRAGVQVPVLRKDFILDPVQLYESRAAGASAVLLIVRALDRVLLAELSRLARELGLDVLAEVHSLAELDSALLVTPASIGVNSRDLMTFEVDVESTAAILQAVPGSVPAVAESGLKHRTDIERVAEWGADAVLVGTALASAPDPSRAVATLTGVPRRGRG